MSTTESVPDPQEPAASPQPWTGIPPRPSSHAGTLLTIVLVVAATYLGIAWHQAARLTDELVRTQQEVRAEVAKTLAIIDRHDRYSAERDRLWARKLGWPEPPRVEGKGESGAD